MLRAGKITLSLCLLALVVWRLLGTLWFCFLCCSTREAGSLGMGHAENMRYGYPINPINVL